MMRWVVGLVLATGSMTAAAADDRAIGETAFEQGCAVCHGATPVARAPDRAKLKEMPPEHIYKVMTEGLMVLQASALNDMEKKAVAIYLSGIEWGSTPTVAATEDLKRCEASPAVTPAALEAPHWSGWGLEPGNARAVDAATADLPATALSDLELKWSFGFAGATAASTQPAVAGDRIFLGSDNGNLYALDAATGCAHWVLATPDAGGVRGAVLLGRSADGNLVVYAGNRKGWYYAVDANSGALLWKHKVDDHPWAMVTGSAKLHQGTLYVPVASFEELAGGSESYECCTFRGSVVALDAGSGTRIWKSFVVLEEPAKIGKNAAGTQLWAPSGVAIWGQPTIDEKAGVLYVTTGDAYTSPAAPTSDSIVAMDLATGNLVWHVQTTANDAFTTACEAPNADPVARENCGPDLDFGASAILRELPGGRRVLLAGQKSGVLHALDPDNNGAILWQTKLSPGGVIGGIEWGMAANDKHVFVPISDVWENRSTPGEAGGIYAVDIATGAVAWHTPAPAPDCHDLAGCSAGQPQAPTLIPGVVFSGSMDGHMRAYDAADGDILWEVDTAREFDTVNDVPARGGSINGAGATVINGWVYFGSGYGLFGMPGNVFVAYGPKAPAQMADAD